MKPDLTIQMILAEYNAWIQDDVFRFTVEEPALLYGNFFDNKLNLVKAIRRGMPFHIFSSLRSVMPFSDTEWADYLGMSLKSLQRYSVEQDFIFKPLHAEKILELAEVTQLGNAVFDQPSQFHHWLGQSHYALGNIPPIELIRDSYGKEIVLQELHRIDHGIFS